MKRLTYQAIPAEVTAGSLIDFKEYYYDMYSRKKLSLSIEKAPVVDVIPANERIDRSTLEKYSGCEVDDQYAQAMCSVGYPRIVIQTSDDPTKPTYRIISVVEAFMVTGLQELTVEESDHITMPQQDNPAHLLSAGVKGFSDYEFGVALKRPK